MNSRTRKDYPVTHTAPRRPLHDRILQDVEGQIVSGAWPPGFRIPFEYELMEQYGCSRMTVNKALSYLVKRGLIERRRKSGSYVMHPHTRSAVLEIRDLESEVAALGLSYQYMRLALVRRKANSSDQQLLGINRRNEVVALQLMHLAGGEPFCFEVRLINISAVPEVAEETFENIPPGRWLINRVPWSAAEHRIRAVNADRITAKQLKLKVGDACLVIERRTWNNDTYITHVKLHYSGDHHELVAQFGPPRP
ncbi:MAG: histidine utilization repressor [Rhizobiaceae bacterium]|nr:histidine utilization repressor [Rhizobiaceae bacterium]